MTLRSLLPISAFGSIATITGEESLEKAYGFIQYNKEFIQSFQNVIISVNKTDNCSMDIVSKYKFLWLDIVPNAVFRYNPVNRGHMFGTIDLDESIVAYVKVHLPQTKYLFKSSEDMLLSTILLDAEYTQSDFYYLPGFSYETILKAGGIEALYRKIKTNEYPYWTPQTNLFMLNIHMVVNLYGNDIECRRSKYLEAKSKNNLLQPWDVIFDDGIKFDCENFLARSVENMSKQCLISVGCLKNLLTFVFQNCIGDPSHKNIFFEDIGLCHYHFWQKEVHMLTS